MRSKKHPRQRRPWRAKAHLRHDHVQSFHTNRIQPPPHGNFASYSRLRRITAERWLARPQPPHIQSHTFYFALISAHSRSPRCLFFFVLSLVVADSSAQVKFWEGGDPPPCFTIDGMNYIYVRKNGLLFSVSTQWNVSPSMFLELLNRLAKVFKDYCGVLSEVRASFYSHTSFHSEAGGNEVWCCARSRRGYGSDSLVCSRQRAYAAFLNEIGDPGRFG